ncbi:hypothetical protein TPHA_0H02430 [Tetrapisispora phaffii CBS 4417]|uniref:Cell division control protein 50 n=1 Tax=Tetrapisispora phaffii (strain ATCC 24235 / CBS 4417 / NBRC 1672 / NRRL Y-8282 / UCD 70-5) TaxID=1071381 RepID=G8BWJ5_TETPH|nr:hypothetical protein TPHA_0H02430 [Tetrapisispora phaffii CBS 4417]CCE64446.1 hypothetical protein TPHA_0H02430 [Tetrapisispora phaffii CBS 4417]
MNITSKFKTLIPFISEDSEFEESAVKSNRPPNTAFRQQRLKSWQPILNPRTVLPLLIMIACIFTPAGVGLIISPLSVQDVTINYTDCSSLATTSNFTEIPHKLANYHFKSRVESRPLWKLGESSDGDVICQIKFEVPNNIDKSIYVYYKLTNFHQNHRRYVDSRDWNQLKGHAVKLDDIVNSCKPLRERDEKIVYPCGLIANSMFNDTFSTTLQNEDGEANSYNLTNKKIAWKTDRKRYKKTKYNATEIAPPPNWIKKFPDGYTDDNIPDLSTWEELQVWMRTAGQPDFYKLALKNEQDELYQGTYIMEITDNYPIKSYGGTKSFVLTTITETGGRNISLGVVFIIVAGISIIVAFIFVIKLFLQPRAMGDQAYLNFADEDELKNNSDVFDPEMREIL